VEPPQDLCQGALIEEHTPTALCTILRLQFELRTLPPSTLLKSVVVYNHKHISWQISPQSTSPVDLVGRVKHHGRMAFAAGSTALNAHVRM
jgi:hypothetical protein